MKLKTKQPARSLAFALMALMQALALTLLTGIPVAKAQESQVQDAAATTPLCRFGVNVHRDDDVSGISDFDTTPLRMGWYLDYTANRNPARPNGANYVQMIRLSKVNNVNRPDVSTDEINAIIARNPGATWFIGNEPDRRRLQDDVLPERYAELYHDLYTQIKGQDPTARVFPGSIVQGTEVRLKYLDRVLAAYRSRYGTLLPADGWSIHGFVLNEVNPDNNPDNLETWGAEIPPGLDDATGLVIHDDVSKTMDMDLFTQNIERFRGWMLQRGYRNTPLYLSEFGVLIPPLPGYEEIFNEGRVNAYMDQTFDYLLSKTDPRTGYPADGNRLVQKLSWFSTYDPTFNGDLFNLSNKQLTLIGQNYAQYTQNLSVETDFYPISLFTRPVSLAPGNAGVDLKVEATVANAGNNHGSKSVRMQFYNGDPTAGGVLIGTQTVALSGCGATTTASVTWSNVAPATYDLYVVAEAVDSAAELNTDNNTRSFRLLHNAERNYLPLMSR